MHVGRFTDRITVQARTSTNDGGVKVDTFAGRIADGLGTCRVPCRVESATAQNTERIFGMQADVVATHLVFLYTWREIEQDDRVLWHTGRARPTHTGLLPGDRVLEIRAMTELGDDRRFMVLACEERSAP